MSPGRALRALLERRLALLSPSRRQRFNLALVTVERAFTGQGVRVLDAGCGDGLLTEAVARRNPTWQVVGIDSSATALSQARARATVAGLQNVSFIEADLTESLGESVYDVVLAIECLEEIDDDQRAVRMLRRALAPEGVLLLHVPERGWRPVFRGSADTWRHEVRHGYDREEIAQLIEEAGLTIVEIRGSYRRLVQLAQEIRDRIKRAPLSIRALAFPWMVLAVRLESVGFTWGREQALFAVAVRYSDATEPPDFSKAMTASDRLATEGAHHGVPRAYVTVLSADSYLDGLLALNESLRLCNSIHPLHVVVGSRVSDAAREVIARAGMPSIVGPPIEIPEDIRLANLRSDHHKHWDGVFEKLLVFSLSEFEKIVYVDSDMIVVKNIDHLFDRPHMSAVIADIFPGKNISRDLNAGLMVIEPEETLTSRLLDSLSNVFQSEKQWRRTEGRPVSMGVQSVINTFWGDWIHQTDLHLSGKYNVLVDHIDYYVRSLGYRWRGPEGIHVLHFIGETKPWMRSHLDSWRLLARLLLRRRTSEALALLVYLAVRQSAKVKLVKTTLRHRPSP